VSDFLHDNNIAPKASGLDAMLGKIQALLANSEDETLTSETREAYRLKAEALMFKYRIDETMAAAAAPASGPTPVWRTFWICRSTSEFSSTYRYMWATAVGHVDGKSAIGYATNPEDGHRWLKAETVGYESDLRYAELIYTSMHLGFAGKMEPRYDASKSDAENAYAMRSAGMEGWRIAQAIWGDDSKPNRVKARKLFAQYASSIGEDPSVLLGRGNNVKTYRESYSDGFQREMWYRLQRMRLSHGDSGEMVLKSRKENVTEAYYARYPHLRPGSTTHQPAIGGRDTCDKCKKAKSGYCREHQWLKPRMGRYVERAYSAAGDARGRAAAQSVDLGRQGGSNRVHGGSTRSLGRPKLEKR
jgi:hypothetical protein